MLTARGMIRRAPRSFASAPARSTPLRLPLIPNVTAQPETDPAEIRRLLVEQLVSPVRWVESVQFMTGAGVTTFWEIGAGKVLGGLIKRIAPTATIEQSEAYL
jgi:malonyl CoA-acyl carrier protein transacylase